MDLSSLYTEVILWELETLPWFIIGARNLNNIRYTDHNVLMADMERQLQDLFESLAKESEKKEILTINCKKTHKVQIT